MHSNWKLTIDYWLTNSEAVEGRSSFKSHWSYCWERWQNKVYHWKCIQNKNNPCRFVSKCLTSNFSLHIWNITKEKNQLGLKQVLFWIAIIEAPIKVLIFIFLLIYSIKGNGKAVRITSESCHAVVTKELSNWSLGRLVVCFCVTNTWAGLWPSFVLMFPGRVCGPLCVNYPRASLWSSLR